MNEPWLTVTLSGNEARPIAVQWPYHPPTLALFTAEFRGEGGTARFDWERKLWLLPRSQFPALCAVFGDRMSVHPDVWAIAYPCRRRAARRAHA